MSIYLFFVDVNSNIDSLERALERFINIETNLLAASDILKNIDVNESIQHAVELKNLLTISPAELFLPKTVAMKNKNIFSLKSSLSRFDWLNTDHYMKGLNGIEADNLKRIFLIAYQLLTELNHVDNELQNKQSIEDTRKEGKKIVCLTSYFK